MRTLLRTTTLALVLGAWACGGGEAPADAGDGTEPGAAATEGAGESMAASAGADGTDRSLFELWNDGAMGFGVYVPQEQYTEAGAAELAANPLYDFLFLNLEGAYEPAAVESVSAGVGMADAGSPPILLVRIPPMSAAGEDTTRERVDEILAAGADGVTLPHIRDVDEARTAISFFEGQDVWSPDNPDGTVLAMIMLEDPQAIAQLDQIIELGGYSVLACGIGSLTGALDGDREQAEAMCAEVRDRGQAAGYASVITANAGNIEQRVEEGHLALLMFGAEADDVIRTGMELAGR